MKLWVDDVRPVPEGYIWCKSVNDAKNIIEQEECAISVIESNLNAIDLEISLIKGKIPEELEVERDMTIIRLKKHQIVVIDMDHDAGEFVKFGGDYIKLLDWLEETGRNYPIHIHSQNPVGVANMRAIIQRNGWKEV